MKLKSVILLLSLVISMTVSAKDIIVGDAKYKTLSKETVMLKDYTMATGDIVIPSTVSDPKKGDLYKVVEIGEEAFKNSGVTSVVIPNSVQKIRNLAFDNCKKLVKVVLPETVKQLPHGAFWDCEMLSDVNLDYLESIGSKAFKNCGFTSMTFSEVLGDLGEGALDGNKKLTQITFAYNKPIMPASQLEKDFDAETYLKTQVELVKSDAKLVAELAARNTTPEDYMAEQFRLWALSARSISRHEDPKEKIETKPLYINQTTFYDVPVETLNIYRTLQFKEDVNEEYKPYYRRKFFPQNTRLSNVTIGNGVDAIVKLKYGTYSPLLYGCKSLSKVRWEAYRLSKKDFDVLQDWLFDGAFVAFDCEFPAFGITIAKGGGENVDGYYGNGYYTVYLEAISFLRRPGPYNLEATFDALYTIYPDAGAAGHSWIYPNCLEVTDAEVNRFEEGYFRPQQDKLDHVEAEELEHLNNFHLFYILKDYGFKFDENYDHRPWTKWDIEPWYIYVLNNEIPEQHIPVYERILKNCNQAEAVTIGKDESYRGSYYYASIQKVIALIGLGREEEAASFFPTMCKIVTDNGRKVNMYAILLGDYLNKKGYKVSFPTDEPSKTQGSKKVGTKSKSNSKSSGSNDAAAAAAEYLIKKGVNAYQERRDAKRFEKWVKKKGKI